MARVSREQAALNKVAIAQASARLFREHGLNGVSVAELMASVGLTHGGFYGHFDSKDELAAAACALAFEQRAQHWQARLDEGGESPELFVEMVSSYLSPRHRDNRGSGCTAVALASDISREGVDERVREAFINGVKRMAQTVQRLSGAQAGESGRAQALARIATMVGAVTLSRATKGDPISEEILEAALAALTRPEVSHG